MKNREALIVIDEKNLEKQSSDLESRLEELWEKLKDSQAEVSKANEILSDKDL